MLFAEVWPKYWKTVLKETSEKCTGEAKKAREYI
jgi:hypothetical protein